MWCVFDNLNTLAGGVSLCTPDGDVCGIAICRVGGVSWAGAGAASLAGAGNASQRLNLKRGVDIAQAGGRHCPRPGPRANDRGGVIVRTDGRGGAYIRYRTRFAYGGCPASWRHPDIPPQGLVAGHHNHTVQLRLVQQMACPAHPIAPWMNDEVSSIRRAAITIVMCGSMCEIVSLKVLQAMVADGNLTLRVCRPRWYSAGRWPWAWLVARASPINRACRGRKACSSMSVLPSGATASQRQTPAFAVHRMMFSHSIVHIIGALRQGPQRCRRASLGVRTTRLS